MDPETVAMIQWLMQAMGTAGGGMGVSMEPDVAAMFGGLVQPNLNKYGEPEVYDVDAQSKATNQLQNVYSTQADMMNAMQAGVGSFGASPLGGGVVGGGGLNPITTETILETPVTLQTQWMAQQFNQGAPGSRSLEGLIASKLVGDPSRGIPGQDPSLIMSDLMAKLNDPEGSGLDPGEAALFRMSLPQKDVLDLQGNPQVDEAGNAVTTVDWNAARKWIEDKATGYQTEQGQLMGPNITQNAYGQYVSLSEKPSAAMEWLQKMGLPDPRSQYGVDFALQSSPELQAMMQNIATTGQAHEEARNAYQKFIDSSPMRAQLIASRNKAKERREGRQDEQYRQDLIDYTRDLASWARGDQDLPPPIEGRKESWEEGPSSSLPGWITGPAKAVGNYTTDMLQSMHPGGGTPAGLVPGHSGTPTNFPELIRRSKPPTMPQRPQGRSMTEMLLGGIQEAPFGTSRRLFNEMNRQRRGVYNDVMATAPIMGAMAQGFRAGRTPFKDAMMQRLQPLIAVGGAG